MQKMIDQDTLKKRQGWPLERKVAESIKRIREWYEAFDGAVSVAYSGGLDSTVLIDIVRSVYPDVPGVFSNTGLEYPENVSHVKQTPNVEVIRPAMPFHQVIKKWGYPVVSKRVAQYVCEVQRSNGETATKRLRLTGIKSDGTFSPISMIPRKWLHLCSAPFAVSDRCCNEIKKKPMDAYMKRTGRMPFVGILAAESQQRTQVYYLYGCNAFDIKRPRSAPLSFWTHRDILAYIETRNLPYSKIYDKGHDQTGCMYCMFGVHLDQARTGTNRFIKMKEDHPRHWDYCINRLGIGQVLDYIGVPYEDKQMKLWAS